MWYSDEVKEYASAIHRLTCRASHIDQCGWFYNQREFDYERTLKIANELHNICTPEQLHVLADIIVPGTKDWK